MTWAAETTRGSICLASRSPRRQDALFALGIAFQVRVSEVEDRLDPGPDPIDPVPIAIAKARDIVAIGGNRLPGVVLAADTIVALGAEPLGKPMTSDVAVRMLQRLRGQAHAVRTGVAMVTGNGLVSGEVSTPLAMRDYSDDDIVAYVATGEALDCAGSYDARGGGGTLIASISGCISSVVGFPILAIAGILRDAGVDVPVNPVEACTSLYGRPCVGVANPVACALSRVRHGASHDA
ncbi:MAG: septum formation protein Maf [Chloroflexi bacterium]|nr:septum formation protein Maf [Chloroflexota bacterium]